MKKIILFLSAIFIGLSILFSCSDNEDKIENVMELKLATKEISVVVGEKKTVEIVTGNAPYEIISSNTKIKTSLVKGLITIEGVISGDTVITVTDAKKKVAKIKVKVKAEMIPVAVLKLDKTELNLKKDEKGTIYITAGSGKYTVKSIDNTIATVINTGVKIVVTAVKSVGTTKVVVTDTVSKQTKKITITVTAVALKLDKTELNLKKEEKGIIHITAGSGKYTVKSIDDTIAIVTNTGVKIVVTAVISVGTTKVVVTDTVSKQTIEVTVIVAKGVEAKAIVLTYFKNGKVLTPYKTDSDGPYFKTKVGDVITIKITGGTGSGQMIVGIPAGTSYLEILDTKEVSKNHIVQNNSFRVKIKSVTAAKNIYFQVQDTDGVKSEYMTFEIQP